MKYFITFGDKKYSNSVNRIINEAKSLEIFDYIKGFRENDLKEDFVEFWGEHSKIIEENDSWGYGFWIWKPYLVLKTLKEMKEDDILLYADAGCHLNIKGKERMEEYIKIVENSKYGILSFQMTHQEKKYTKSDVLKYFDLELNSEIAESGQIIATTFMLKKCEYVEKIVKMWYETCCNYHLVDNSESIIPNDKEYVATRCDQSIWSIIRKKYGSEILEDETYRNPNWDEKYPIMAMRIKQ